MLLPSRSHFMKAYLLVLLLLACSGFGSKAMAKADYVKDYHPLINQAELLIQGKEYAAALETYRKAFSAVSRPFAKDYYNAATCAMLTDDEKLTMHYLEKLVEAGVSLEYLEQQKVFVPLHETKSWKKFVKKYPKRRKAFTQKADLDLRADLDELYARDQYFRQAKGGLKVHGDTLRKIEANNVKTLLAWISQHGYPGEELIGVADTLEQLPRFSIVIQRQTTAKGGFDFTSILTQAVHEGKLEPHAAAYLMDQQQGKNLYRSKILVKVNCNKPAECESDKELEKVSNRYLTEKLSEKEEENVNERRAALGLESVDDYRTKMRYALEDPRFKLGYTWAVANYHVPSKEAARALTERLVLAD